MDIFEADDNSTPLTSDEKDGLKLKWIILRSELNEVEARNIGVAPYQISIKLMQLFDDINYWIENKVYDNHEIAVRFHHKLVQIHPFPNGNGRVSRLMTDLVLQKLNGKSLYWGNTDLVNVSEVRIKYIEALRKADSGDYADLIQFTKGE